MVVIVGLLEGSLRHCVTDAARQGPDAADAVNTEGTRAIERLVRS